MSIVGKPGILRIINSRVVYQTIVNQGCLSRPAISTITQLSLPTVNKVVKGLLDVGLIMENAELSSEGLGRKAKTYSINEDAAHLLILCYQNEEWVGTIQTLTGRCVYQYNCEVSRPGLTEFEVLNTLIDHFIQRDSTITAIGIGVPGIVLANGNIIGVPSIPTFENFPVQKALEDRHNLPVYVENDVKLMTFGYHHAKLDESQNVVFLYIGKGVGAGILINGALYKGSTDFAGEIGYMVTCDEGAASTETLLSAGRKRLKALPGDAPERKRFLSTLVSILVNITSLLDPDVVVLSCDILTTRDMEVLKRGLKDLVPAQSVPQMHLIIGEPYAQVGLYHHCRNGFFSSNYQPKIASQAV